LTAVGTAYATPPFPPLSHPPIKLPSFQPRGGLHLDRRIDLSAICFGALLHVVVAEIHTLFWDFLGCSLTRKFSRNDSERGGARARNVWPTSPFDLGMGYFSIIG
jgi:hypothetical protein